MYQYRLILLLMYRYRLLWLPKYHVSVSPDIIGNVWCIGIAYDDWQNIMYLYRLRWLPKYHVFESPKMIAKISCIGIAFPLFHDIGILRIDAQHFPIYCDNGVIEPHSLRQLSALCRWQTQHECNVEAIFAITFDWRTQSPPRLGWVGEWNFQVLDGDIKVLHKSTQGRELPHVLNKCSKCSLVYLYVALFSKFTPVAKIPFRLLQYGEVIIFLLTKNSE